MDPPRPRRATPEWPSRPAASGQSLCTCIRPPSVCDRRRPRAHVLERGRAALDGRSGRSRRRASRKPRLGRCRRAFGRRDGRRARVCVSAADLMVKRREALPKGGLCRRSWGTTLGRLCSTISRPYLNRFCSKLDEAKAEGCLSTRVEEALSKENSGSRAAPRA